MRLRFVGGVRFLLFIFVLEDYLSALSVYVVLLHVYPTTLANQHLTESKGKYSADCVKHAHIATYGV